MQLFCHYGTVSPCTPAYAAWLLRGMTVDSDGQGVGKGHPVRMTEMCGVR